MSIELDIQIAKSKLALTKGGAGSGNFGHAGRPGQVGGSSPGDGAGGSPELRSAVKTVRQAMKRGGNSADNHMEMVEEDLMERYGLKRSDAKMLYNMIQQDSWNDNPLAEGG